MLSALIKTLLHKYSQFFSGKSKTIWCLNILLIARIVLGNRLYLPHCYIIDVVSLLFMEFYFPQLLTIFNDCLKARGIDIQQRGARLN